MAAQLDGSLHHLVHGEKLQWIFVGGKGGVGKTTTSCSLAVALTKTRNSVLLVSTDPAHNLSDAFSQKFSREPTRVNGFENLDAMEVEPPENNELPGSSTISTDSSQTMDDPSGMASAFGDIGNALPGIDEAMAFGTLMKQVREMAYDVVVFDTAPTGHTLRLLGFPDLLQKGLNMFRSMLDRFGPMADSMASTMGMPGLNVSEMVAKIEDMDSVTKDVSRIFNDSKKCTFVCVCIPEFLSVFETERLVQEIGKVGISVNNIVVNQIIRGEDVADEKRAKLLYNARINMQKKYMEQVVELYGEDFHITSMPLLDQEVRGQDMLQKYSDMLTVEKKEFTEGMEGMNDIGEYDGNLCNVIDDDNLRWVFVGGKGGVGKTTTSSSIGIALEKKGKKVLLVSTDPAHNISDAFAQKISSGTDPTKLNGYAKLYALEVNATEAAEGFIADLADATEGLAESGGMSQILPMDSVRPLITAIPGIDEAVSFSQIAKLAKSMEFDAVVFDTAPTGHTLRLLQFPTVANKALSRIDSLRESLTPLISMMTNGDTNMQSKIRQMEDAVENAKSGLKEVTSILNDQERTTFVCVAIAEFLSVYETERLVQELCTLNVNVRNIIINQLMDPKENNVIGVLRSRSDMQHKYLNQIDELYPREDFHITLMPLLPMEVRGLEALKEYGSIAVNGEKMMKN